MTDTADILTRLSIRAARLERMVKRNVPPILIRKEALLILSAAMELDTAEGKRELAEWMAKNPALAPDGGALVDLRNDTLDEAKEAVDLKLGDEVSEYVAGCATRAIEELKTTRWPEAPGSIAEAVSRVL
jgi:hypothetical protein